MTRVGFVQSCAGEPGFGRARDGLNAERHNLNCASGVSVAVGLRVEAMKTRDGIG